jgi:neogenin
MNTGIILEHNSEYAISLRAYNKMGDGRPVYETVRTREESAPEHLLPLIPPVGVEAIVLSSSAVVVYWTDTALQKNQV